MKWWCFDEQHLEAALIAYYVGVVHLPADGASEATQRLAGRLAAESVESVRLFLNSRQAHENYLCVEGPISLPEAAE